MGLEACLFVWAGCGPGGRVVLLAPRWLELAGSCRRVSWLAAALLGAGLGACEAMRLVGHCAAARILLRLGVAPPGGVLAAAVTSPRGGSSLREPGVYAAECGGGACSLWGEKVFVTNGVDADHLVVYASMGGAPAVFLVDRGAGGVSAEPMGLSAYSCSGVARLLLRGAGGRVAAHGAPARRAVVEGLGENRVLVAALAVGLGREAVRLAAEWAEARGVLSRQAVSHRLAAAAAGLEAAGALVERTAERVDRGAAGLWEASAAKYVAVEAAVGAVRAARLTLGGYAFAEEEPGRRLRFLEAHVAALEPAEGTQDVQLEIVARGLLARRG